MRVTTLSESLIGLVTGDVLGALLALAMSFLPLTTPLLLPVMVVSQAMPVFAIAPLLALWFGFGLASKMVMATIAIFFPVASAFADGLPAPIRICSTWRGSIVRRAGRW